MKLASIIPSRDRGGQDVKEEDDSQCRARLNICADADKKKADAQAPTLCHFLTARPPVASLVEEPREQQEQ